MALKKGYFSLLITQGGELEIRHFVLLARSIKVPWCTTNVDQRHALDKGRRYVVILFIESFFCQLKKHQQAAEFLSVKRLWGMGSPGDT